MQMPSAFATCGGGQTGGGGGGETGTHAPPTGSVPVGQPQMPSTLSTNGGWHIGAGLQSRMFSTLTVVVGELIGTGLGEIFVVHTGVVLGGHTFGNGNVPSVT